MRSPFELQSLVEWLRKQVATDQYEYTSCTDCILHQYLRSMGLPVKYVGPDVWSDEDGRIHYISPHFQEVARRHPVSAELRRGNTFGAALKRAESLLAKQAA